MKGLFTIVLLLFCSTVLLVGQKTTVAGEVKDGDTREPLIGAAVQIKGTTIGAITDFDGQFSFKYDKAPPFTLEVTYIGFTPKEIEFTEVGQKLKIKLGENAATLDVVEVVESVISVERQEDPQTKETFGSIAIKETPASDFYEGMGALPGIDATKASLGFTIINTRGFNSTSPVRSLQTIDGVDNQAPGLNFSLGNFLGSSELDINKVELLVGANGAYYGPNAFNGVISMNTKSPFIQEGVSVKLKGGERSLFDGAIRIAKAYKDANGKNKFAFKVNAAYLRASDWEANNYDEVYQENTEDYIGTDNPGGYDAVNIYGDESFNANFDRSGDEFIINQGGIGRFFRTGYIEKDVVDYDTRNLKLNAAVHYMVKPKIELITSFNYSTGTTVYQGDNRFSLNGLRFYQGRVEIRKENKFFLRAYGTVEDANNTYDAYFTALKLVELNKEDFQWALDFAGEWEREVMPEMRENGYPVIEFDEDGKPTFNTEEARQWIADNQDFLRAQHQITRDFANNEIRFGTVGKPFLVPGTPEFEAARDSITSLTHLEGGTGFFDKSKLFHVHGEYHFNPTFVDDITVGANARQYRPLSNRTIFEEELIIGTRLDINPETNDTTVINVDTTFQRITNFEFGVYGGFEKKVYDDRIKINGTVRMDKNENIDYVFSPAISAVFKYNPDHIIRFAFASAIRNPTLTDQYLFYNVGRAILKGNITGFDDLVTVDSFNDYRDSTVLDLGKLDSFSVAPIRPEKVQTMELGYRASLFKGKNSLNKKLFIDASYYFSYYKDFIGYNIGIDIEGFDALGFPQGLQVYRVAANATQIVTTQGATVGLNYYLGKYYSISGNYSWNFLNTGDDDPLVPAFNTPEHKYNIGIGGRNIKTEIGNLTLKDWGFNVNYKWVEGFLFEGSPQFTGLIPSYGLLDAQVNYAVKPIKSVVKVGASNILNNKQFQVYGGPRIGRMAYVSISMDLGKF